MQPTRGAVLLLGALTAVLPVRTAAWADEPAATSPPATTSMAATPWPEAQLLLLPPGSRLRITMVAPHEPGAAKNGSSTTRKVEGELVGLDGDAYVLSAGHGRVRVPHRDVRSLEMREPGNAGWAVVGGLAGLTGGLVVTALACLTADLPCNTGVVWLGTLAGGAIGGAAAGSGSWKTVALPASSTRVSVAVAPTKRGAAVALAIRF